MATTCKSSRLSYHEEGGCLFVKRPFYSCAPLKELDLCYTLGMTLFSALFSYGEYISVYDANRLMTLCHGPPIGFEESGLFLLEER
ncbi:hypothetical protein GA0061096_4353 [Fictibacillus enclensis]|uniref:Uncharacterized protein n=1 Tax=Fictibacillus enclensis TaxID=1017270 RepID=A0A0V8J0D2_9BACL|nr:hypothetical protein AS030_20745 [Fictibacillus enclensis]SCC38510.1 hypothetical protein GA0061096_4353 [Fictibacillus enclensis]